MSFTSKTPAEIKQDEIEEYKSDLKRIQVAGILASDPDTAICVRIALGKDQYFDYWIEDNLNAIALFNSEEEIVRALMNEASAPSSDKH